MKLIVPIVVMLSGCAYLPQPDATQRAQSEKANIVVSFLSEKEVRQACEKAIEFKSKGIFAQFKACAIINEGVCNVIITEPKDFNDVESLAVFGHEIWHCFGAKH